jgi:hypothetical protein
MPISFLICSMCGAIRQRSSNGVADEPEVLDLVDEGSEEETLHQAPAPKPAKSNILAGSKSLSLLSDSPPRSKRNGGAASKAKFVSPIEDFPSLESASSATKDASPASSYGRKRKRPDDDDKRKKKVRPDKLINYPIFPNNFKL